jgi:hypothetical protein
MATLALASGEPGTKYFLLQLLSEVSLKAALSPARRRSNCIRAL